jgi:hypothetical protein
MTVDLTGHVNRSTRKLRLTTNLEMSYDQIFLAVVAPHSVVQTRKVPMVSAELRWSGFAREYTPDGAMPLIYDYHLVDTTAPFRKPSGKYTRYGDAMALLSADDDEFAILGPGDEIALEFDASALPKLADGDARDFILVSRAYCKDMDLYTGAPRTLEPLPFRLMPSYPYCERETVPPANQREYVKRFNTRVVD